MPAPDSADLVRSVAQALVLAIECRRHTDSNDKDEAAPHIFDSSVVPNVSVEKYLHRLKAVFECSDAVFVLALIIVDRLLENDRIQPHRLTMRNVHRLFLASLIVTVKYNEDLVFGNSHYARAGGIQLREVNRLERFFVRALDYNFHVQPEQYEVWEQALRALRPQQPAGPTPEAPLAPSLSASPPLSSNTVKSDNTIGSRYDGKLGYAKAPPVAVIAKACATHADAAEASPCVPKP